MSICDQEGLQKALTPVADALMQILASVTPITHIETIPLNKAYGRILASAAVSPMNVPPEDNSAMDGYAIGELGYREYTCVGEAFAGHPYQGTVKPDECIRIMTGAPVPSDCSLVEMQENATVVGNVVTFTETLKAGSNIRRAGEDIALGSHVLTADRRLTPSDCGLLASIGLAQVEVKTPIKVALFTTGDELIAPGTPLKAGQIYESNSYVLTPILQKLGAELIVLPAVEDNENSIKKALHDASEKADIVITCGGVSVGEADFTRKAVEALGQLELWKLAMKPGKPLAFGRINNCLFLGLPGNPVSALVTLHQAGLPLLRKLSGEQVTPNIRLSATTTEILRKRPGRADYQRGIASVNSPGQLEVRSTGLQGSGILTSVSQANCFIVLEQERGRVEVGETVMVEMFDEWLK
ncbi:MAG: gephyrin-like molybdotransferase Glp [Thalassolituus sp.]|jgi:molybdopterin molybdotransferase